MVKAQIIRDGMYLISWVTSSVSYKTAGEVIISFKENFPSGQLSYREVGNKVMLDMFLLKKEQTGSCKSQQEPSNVIAIKSGLTITMTKSENMKWTASFPIAPNQCCGWKSVLVFEMIIDFAPKSMSLVKTESKRVLDNLTNLWESKILADVTFKIQEKEIKAHSLILASGSPVLAAMFQHNFKENREKIVEIQDVKPLVFEKLLRFIYTGDTDLENETITDLLMAADKYGIDSLKQECALHLSEIVTVENAVDFLVLSHLHNSPILYESTLDFMSKNAKAICSRKDWMEVIKKFPELSFAAMQLMVLG